MHSLVDLLAYAAHAYNDKRFAFDADAPDAQALSFRTLAEQADRIAAALARRFQVKPGDRVALLLPNTLSFLPAYFGILRLGATAVPVNARLKAHELAFILHDCDTQTLFVHPKTWRAASEALPELPHLKQLVCVGFSEPPPSRNGYGGTLTPFDELLIEHAPPPPQPDIKGSDVAAIIYTSGTTGRPKGAMLTHRNILFNIEATRAGHGLLPTDIHLLVVPLFHVTGLNTIMPTALAQGAQLAISAEIDPEALLQIIHRCRCSTFFGVPTTFYLLTHLMEWPIKPSELTSLHMICYSGAPMSPQTIEKLRALFPHCELHNFFGLTETTSVSTVLSDAQALKRSESVGRPPPGIELGIEGEDGKLLPPNRVGELVIRGPSVFKGYFKNPGATREAMKGGWFHTGDIAMLDEEGYLFLKGRKKEMIIVAGENVYPIEVEHALCAHAAIQEAAVFGRPDKALGEVVHAAVVLRPGQSCSERELKRFLIDRLAAFKQPRSIRFLEALPRNPSGKVMKRDL